MNFLTLSEFYLPHFLCLCRMTSQLHLNVVSEMKVVESSVWQV